MEKIILSNKPLEISEHKSYKQATFLVSVLGEYNLNGVLINEEEGEKFYKTLIGQPIQAALKYDENGMPSNFGGHEVKTIVNENGDIEFKFMTTSIGAITDAWIEEREVDGYKGKHKCILISAKLWKDRYPEYFGVFDKLMEDGGISSSWEISVEKSEKTKKGKILKVFEWIGNTLLGQGVQPAVTGAGVLECSSIDSNTELSNALLKDLTSQTSELSIDENSKREVKELENETQEQVVENADTIVASLTIGDIYSQLANLICVIKENHWSHIAYLYPEDHKAICKDYDAESEQDFFEVSYEIVEDKVQLVGEPIEKKLSFVDVSSIKEKEDAIASLENEKKTLSTQVTELSTKLSTIEEDANNKNDALVKANENNVALSSQIETLNKEISELNVYKEQVEKINAEKQAQEIAEKKEALKGLALKSKLITEEEIETSEVVKPLIEELNEQGIKNLIAERYIASMNEEKNVETSQVKPQQEKIDLASKDTFDSESLIKKYITK